MAAAAPARKEQTGPTGLEKAAIFVMYLDREAAKTLLANLKDDELAKVGGAIAEMDTAGEDLVESVVREFVSELGQVSVLPTSGRAFARDVLPGLVEESRRGRVLEVVKRSSADDFEAFIRARPARAIATVLADEHPQVRAIALLRMGPENAARVLNCFPAEEHPDLTIRMAKAETVAPELADDIEASLRRALPDIRETMPIGGIDLTARILGKMPRAQNDIVLGGVRLVEETLADDLNRRMVVFDDLIRLDNRAMQTLIRSVDRRDLVAALHGSNESMRARVLANLSTRAAEELEEELSLGGPVSKSRSRESQERVVAVARQLADAGTIEMGEV